MADGQVLIDSKLNIDGVEKGTKQIEKEFEQLADVSAKTAKKVAKSFENSDYKKAFDDLSDSAKKAYTKIEMIRSNDADDNKSKAAKIAAVYRDLGDDQSTAMKRAWAVIKDESDEGSRKVIDDLKEIGEKAEKTGKQIKGIGKGFKDVFGSDFLVHFLSDVAANAFDSLSDFIIDTAKQAVESAAEISAANAMFEQTFKGVEKSARKALQTISEETQISTTRMQTSFAKIFAFTKAVGADTEKAMDMAARAARLAADNAAYFDTSVEEATETIYSFIKGNYENDAALNLVANEMARNAAAYERYGKSFQELNGVQQADTLLAMAEAANLASGAYGQAAREADSWANVTGELSEAWKQFTAVFGESAIETMTPVIQGITNALNEYLELRRKLEEKKNPVAEEFSEIEEAAPPVVEAIDEIAEAYKNATNAAREALDSQIGYFEAVNLESDMSAKKIVENWQSQQEAFANYTANLQKAMDMGLDDILIKQLSDGSTESMMILDALVNDCSVTADEINLQWAKTEQMRDITANVLGGIQSDLTGMSASVESAIVGSTESTAQGIENALSNTANTIQNTAFTPMEESGTATAEATSEAFDDAANTMKTAWSGMGTWFESNVASPIRISVESVSTTMTEKLGEMVSETQTAWANMVLIVNQSIDQMQNKINSLTGKTVDINFNKTGAGAEYASYSGYDGKAYTPTAYASASPAAAMDTPATYSLTPQVPVLASGAIIPPMAIPSASAKYSGMNKGDLEALAQKIAAAVNVTDGAVEVRTSVNFEGSLAQLGRVLKPVIDTETKRVGKSLASEIIKH